MEGEQILKNYQCDCGVAKTEDPMVTMEKKRIAAAAMACMKNPYTESGSSEKKEPVHGILNEIQEVTDQIGRLSEDIRLQIIGPVTQGENAGGGTYRLKDRLIYERSKLYIIRGILEEIRNSI